MTGTALERCVGDVRTFAEEHWGRAPLLHRGEPEGFAGLLDLGDVDHLVTETLLRMPGFRMVRDGTPLDPSSYTRSIRIGGRSVDRTARPERVIEEFAEGATIVLQALHRQSGPVARFCRELELDLTHPVQANAYVTPPTARGFSVHHDTHDVFVMQTHGRKAWRVYRPVVPLAGPEQPWRSSLGDVGEPILEAELAPGDCLYLPRGYPHDAEAQDGVSIHVTVGITVTTWLDVWRAVMRAAADQAPFRESLPVGFAGDPASAEMDIRTKELVSWLESAAGEEVLAGLADRFWSERRPILDGQLERIAALDEIDTTTTLRRRPWAVFRLADEGVRVRVILGRRQLRLPVFARAALSRIESGEAFNPGDLPGLDDGSRLVLVRRLVREGVLEVVRDGG